MNRIVNTRIAGLMTSIREAHEEVQQPVFLHYDRLTLRRKLNRLIQACVALIAILDEDELEQEHKDDLKELAKPQLERAPAKEATALAVIEPALISKPFTDSDYRPLRAVAMLVLIEGIVLIIIFFGWLLTPR